MRNTIVGLFGSAAEAQNVKQELVKEGYSAADIQVMANEYPAATGTGAGTSSEAAGDTGIAAKISSFFRSLTGGEEDASRYTQGVAKGGALLSVTVPEDHEERIISLLESHGARNIEEGDSAPYSDRVPAALATSTASSAVATADGSAIPVVEEELLVGKRQVQRGGVRVYSHIVETPVEENIRLREEHVTIDRRNVNRPATDADFTAFKEGTIELTETAEEAVVSKNARVVEEIVVGKTASEHTETVRDTVRHTEVEVDELEPSDVTKADAARTTAGGSWSK